ncbi:cadherin-like and PC-esterase domain-containing protein 1 isoform X1 [Patagioenas fasciata]|uniref:cadherin-like and PC-esterase domain-containing protein 1 isoform X1 n=1 Tax=Patagioenas fasciata TaxID=372321 RepID=UPI003A999EBE
MVCGQVPRCRRLCRPRPFLLALVVAGCLFCQTLTPLMTSSILSSVVNGIAPNKLTKTRQGRYKEVSPSNILCFPPGSNSQTVKKIDDSILQYFGSRTRRAVLYAPPAHRETDSQLCQRILTKHGYKVTVLEDRRLVEDPRHEGPYHNGVSPWDLLICLSSRKNDGTGCIQMDDFHHLQLFQKVNLLPEIQHFLCGKEGLCQITKVFSGLQLPVITPECSGQPWLSRASVTGNMSQGSESAEKTRTTHHLRSWWEQSRSAQLSQVSVSPEHQDILKAQDFSVIVKAYVLVTSLTPLRAFIHSTATVWHPPKKKHFTVKLQRFFELFFKSGSPQQAFNNMKEAISKLLLITEIFSESSASGPNSFNRCSQCFQMLTFDIGFGTSIYPVVLKVHGNFDFQDEDESNIQDQTFKEFLFEDTFKFLLSNESSTSTFIETLQKIHGSTVRKDGTYHREDEQCLSLEEINSMITFIQELKSLGRFELLFPSTAPKIQTLLRDLYHMVDPMRRLGSLLTMHWLLSSLLEQFQFMTEEAHTNLSEWDSSQESMSPKQNVPSDFRKIHEALRYSSKTKERQCSYDKDTLSHIRQIFTSPQLDLNPQFNPKTKEYYAEVPFDMVTVKIGAEPSNCQCQVHLDDKKGPRIANYPLGLGLNKVIVLVTDDSQPSPQVVGSYKITIYREDRPSLPLFDDYVMCGFVQDCGSRIRPEESCGLQPLSHEYLSAISQTVFKTCDTGDTKGQWIVPCLSCSDNRTCDWREITWQPHGCRHSVLAKPELQRCVEGRRILFIGDSTNRGMMYYLIERVNKTLQEWQKTHDVKCYHNINEGKTFISYSYYPQFWMNANQRPTFEKALEQLLQRSRPLENTDQTVLIVGGVQWLNSNHLQIIQKVLNRENLSNILVIIKSIGMGFHLPVDGIHSLSQAEVQNLWNENLVILDTAKNFGYEVVDTFIITMGRYKEFLQGKCGCHFHEVVKSNPSEESPHITMTLPRHHTLGKYFVSQSKPSELQDYATNSQSPYHVRGPINQVYSEILLSRLCARKREVVST